MLFVQLFLAMGANWAAGVLKLLFRNENMANVGDATGLRGSTTAGNLYLSLHTADPGASGNQTTNETSYGGYLRKDVPRTTTDWDISGANITPHATVSFPPATSGTATITHFGIGTASSGTGVLLYSGTVTPNISVATGVTPQLTTSTTITES